MAPFHGMALILLGIGYLLHAEPPNGHRTLAVQRFDGEKTDKGERSQRGAKRTYFYKDSPQKVTAVVGQTVVLLCRVKNLGNRTDR